MTKSSWLSYAWLSNQGEKEPYLLRYRSSEAFIIGTVALAVFTDMFLYGLIVPVIPFAIQTKSHVDSGRVQYWVSVLIAIYAAALLAFSPICGWLADRSSSRRSPLVLGLLALLGATVLLNIGSSIGIMIAGRLLQGASAAVVWVVGLALLADTVPQDRLAQAMGYVGVGMSVGIMIGPLLGGVVYERAGYNAVYAMAYALIGIDIVLRLLLVEKKVAMRWTKETSDSQTTSDETAPSDQTDIEKGTGTKGESENTGTDSNGASTTVPATDLEISAISVPDTSTPATKADQTGATNNNSQKRLRERLPPVLSLLYSRRLLAALFGAIIQAAVMTSFDSVLALHAANTFHWHSTGAGLLFLPIVIPSFLGPLFGYISDRYGGRYPATIGFLLACPPLACLRFVDTNTIHDKVLLCALLALIGLFLTLTFPPFMAEISAVVADKEKKMLENGEKGYGKGGAYAQAYALFNMAFAAGCVVGPLLAGFIVQEKGWATMAWVLGLLSAVTAVPSFLWMGGWIFGKKVDGSESNGE
ncbi:MFS general substrate transporter [Byssothecium circinans]|uniref:MFS general substrate transporter n=1 Tax=Byssothecium circinans TaxID=147558 RepID=A0A6A5TQM6_9PLEO|nr:MFS general substrate transporter [Byssothecium circinans]